MRNLILVLVIAVVCPVMAQLPPSGKIQDAIDVAEPGSVIRIPAGTYHEYLRLKDGITLVGENPNTTIIDGMGSPVIVIGARNSALIGLTLRNGHACVANNGWYMGIFSCKLTDFRTHGIRVPRGSAVIADNLICGNSESSGIVCLLSNPYISGNTIAKNRNGILAWQQYVPVVTNNSFVDNTVGICFTNGAQAVMGGNLFSGNQQAVAGGDPGTSDVEGDIPMSQAMPSFSTDVEGYRQMMTDLHEGIVEEHPIVVYDLLEREGVFNVTTLHPWATFTVGASTRDTKIVEHDAFDVVTADTLTSTFMPSYPAVQVKNDGITTREQDRYVLDTLYDHAPSYGTNSAGNVFFKRMTTYSNIRVIIPDGFLPTSVNFPAEFSTLNGRVVVEITDIGSTRIEIDAEPIVEGMEDPYGLLIEE